MEDNVKKVGQFIITVYERTVTEEQLEVLSTRENGKSVADSIKDNDNKTLCLRVEHVSGLWLVEYPSYSKMFYELQTFSEDEEDEKAFEILLQLIMEDSNTIYDNEYYRESFKLKMEYMERVTEEEE